MTHADDSDPKSAPPEARPPETGLPEARGTLLRARNGDVMRYDETGIVMRLSDRVIADIAARLPQAAGGGGGGSGAGGAGPDGGGAAEPADPEVLGDIDAWDLRTSGRWYLFSADLPGDQGPRQYRRLIEPDPPDSPAPILADTPGALLGIFSLGGARAAQAVARPVRFPWHILAPGDDIGAVGMAGVDRAQVTPQPGPLRGLTRDAALAEVLLGERRAHHRALPLCVVRAETDASASAADLVNGVAVENLLTAADSLARIASGLGKRARILSIRLDYSLEDVSGDGAAYGAGMRALMARLTRDLGARGYRKPLFLATFESGTARLTDGPVLRAQGELAWNAGGHDLVFTAPGYMFAQDSCARPTAGAMADMAEMEAAALTAIYDEAEWFCPTFLLAEREGPHIRVKARAMGPLVIDAEDPFGAGALAGFRLEGVANGAALTGVAPAPDDPQDLILTCDRAPEGAPGGPPVQVLYAFGADPRPGPRPAACGSVRDGFARETSRGTTLHRWALPAALPLR
jgi:hypothetical protein